MSRSIFTPEFFRFLGGFVLMLFFAFGVMAMVNIIDMNVSGEGQLACPQGAPEQCKESTRS